jgi:NAD(P)-dependent dehydrogenase (short-subunit alcohol dehydrogenase family)
MKKLALITGGTSGIGFGAAKALGSNCDLALGYASNHEKANVAKGELAGMGFQVETFSQPLEKYADAEALVQAVEAKFGRSPDILVNSAGQIRDGIFMQTSFEQHQKVIEEHLVMTMAMCHASIKAMYKQKFGRIVNLSSISGTYVKRGQSNYAAAKAGIEAFTKTLAMEVAHRGITVNAVAPGLIETPMTKNILDMVRSHDGEGELRKRIPAGRVGTPDEVGGLISYLCSDLAAYITGTTVTIDGGRSLGGD